MSIVKERLARLDQSFAEAEDRKPLQQDTPPVVDCVCGGGEKWGHLNEAGGFCCPHYGDSCGYHSDSEWW